MVSPGVTMSWLCRARFAGRISESPSRSTPPSSESSDEFSTRWGIEAGAGARIVIAMALVVEVVYTSISTRLRIGYFLKSFS